MLKFLTPRRPEVISAKPKQLEVVPIFQPLYNKLEKLDLYAEKALHGAEELIGLLETAVADLDFLFLAQHIEKEGNFRFRVLHVLR